MVLISFSNLPYFKMESDSKPTTNCNSRRSVYIFLIALVLLLDWAALHDILKGEENPLAEYSMLVLSLLLLPLLIFKIFRKI